MYPLLPTLPTIQLIIQDDGKKKDYNLKCVTPTLGDSVIQYSMEWYIDDVKVHTKTEKRNDTGTLEVMLTSEQIAVGNRTFINEVIKVALVPI